MSTDLGPDGLLRFALAVHDLEIGGIGNVVLEGRNATTSGGAAIVRLDEDYAHTTFSDLADGRLDG
jgi:hypothetical protein